MSRVVVADLYSHATMHLPFNEGYLRLLRHAYPDDTIDFFGDPGHVAALAGCVGDVPGISFHALARLSPRWGLSLHNPLAGRLAALNAWQRLRATALGGDVRLFACLGFDANLLSVLRLLWSGKAALHLIAHAQAAQPFDWRSRNPLYRAFDLGSLMRRELPPRSRVVTLELGIAEAFAEAAPAWRERLATLEHPILPGEWAMPRRPDGANIQIGFLGHASLSKGFDLFVDMARDWAGKGYEFSAIGIGSPEAFALDLSPLALPPSRASVPRADYVRHLAAMDFICLPLGAQYRYVASGSVIDAVAALKPLLAARTGTLDALAARYGALGVAASNRAELGAVLADPARLLRGWDGWVENLTELRACRAPERLAAGYRAMVDETRHG